jgi:hypothetical protein
MLHLGFATDYRSGGSLFNGTKDFASHQRHPGVIFSGRIVVLIKVLILDVILQRRILKEDALRWVMHMLIFVGFMLLLIFHAFESWTSSNWFEELRVHGAPLSFSPKPVRFNGFCGCAIAIYRRRVLKVPRLRTNAMDVYAVWIVAVIMITGFCWKGPRSSATTNFSAWWRSTRIRMIRKS